ncbi:protein jagunal homolog 1-like [Ruditapes philippinarum]|uniref:protein jagunal homolog 1-like n=1 Tax=Ruditapes philippinarum TaxID=129788 RepID=UPI00295BF8AD|nr:protein jagunal homolog 1-like [Ruditapes philippinarum]
MSSYGARPAGTDGSDHWHRESVAWQYKISSINKSRLKSSLVLQILLGLVVIVRLLPGLTALIGLPIYRRLQHWDFPAPKAWEYAWIVSLLAAVFGLKSLPRNDSLVLKQFLIGTVVFGILPVLYGVIELFDDLVLYYNERKFSTQIVGYPAVLVWYFGLILCLQIHIFSLYFGVNLLKAWKPRAKKFK